jgi:hypothetical protein
MSFSSDGALALARVLPPLSYPEFCPAFLPTDGVILVRRPISGRIRRHVQPLPPDRELNPDPLILHDEKHDTSAGIAEATNATSDMMAGHAGHATVRCGGIGRSYSCVSATHSPAGVGGS